VNDLPPTDAGSPFVRSLVQAAKNEAPPGGAKARALAGLSAGGAGAFATAAAVASTSARGARRVAPSLIALGGALAMAAAAAVFVTVRGHAPAGALAMATAEPAGAKLRMIYAAGGSPPPDRRAAPAAACEGVSVEDREPTVCSQPGRHEPIEVLNTCGEEIDLYWVDFQCRETFTARLAPGETLRHSTFDTHPWRARDHRTHRLLKEWVGPALPEPSTEPVVLPDLVITDRVLTADVAPTACSRPSSKASLRFVNQRSRGVSVVFWVDDDCHEQVQKRLEPGESWTSNTREAHAWRVRDESGALLADYAAEGADDTVYVAVP
jgi:hypothetical protein